MAKVLRVRWLGQYTECRMNTLGKRRRKKKWERSRKKWLEAVKDNMGIVFLGLEKKNMGQRKVETHSKEDEILLLYVLFNILYIISNIWF